MQLVKQRFEVNDRVRKRYVNSIAQFPVSEEEPWKQSLMEYKSLLKEYESSLDQLINHNRLVSVIDYYTAGALLKIETVVEEGIEKRDRLIVTNLNTSCIPYKKMKKTYVLITFKNTPLVDVFSLPMNVRHDTTCEQLYSIIYHVLVNEYIIKEGIGFDLYYDEILIPEDDELIIPKLKKEADSDKFILRAFINYVNDNDIVIEPPESFMINRYNYQLLDSDFDISPYRVLELDLTMNHVLRCFPVFDELLRIHLNVDKINIYCRTDYCSLYADDEPFSSDVITGILKKNPDIHYMSIYRNDIDLILLSDETVERCFLPYSIRSYSSTSSLPSEYRPEQLVISSIFGNLHSFETIVEDINRYKQIVEIVGS